MRGITLSIVLIALSPSAQAQQEADHDADVVAVTAVLEQYRGAIERLDANGTELLFTEDSQVLENGGVEGNYANYLARHLGPELGHLNAFRFTDVSVSVRFEGQVALTTETYGYRIEPHDRDPIERRGVTTSVLRRTDAGWKIVVMHGSSRAPRPRQTQN